MIKSKKIVRAMSVAFCVCLLLVSQFAVGQVLPMVDTSADGNPVSRSGTATPSDPASDPATAASFLEHWTVKNTSRKPIVTLIESVSVQTPSGRNADQLEQYEMFFNPTLLTPGASVSFDSTSNIFHVGQGPVDYGSHCEIKTLWIQFADGTTFGDARYAKKLLADRKASLQALVHLSDIYTQQGSAQFIAELEKPYVPSEAGFYDMYLRQLRDFYSQSQNIQGTLDKLTAYITTAQSRTALLD
jgi:hypothetical protein